MKRPLLALGAGAGALLGTLTMGLAALASTHTPSAAGVAAQSPASPVGQSQIPPEYLLLYRQAAARYALDWSILAGIGKVECDHGRDHDASCTREGAVNSAGAAGPMQFLAATWAKYGVDGDGDGRVDRWDPADAIFGAANYLRASGAPGDYRAAIFDYNHAGWYVQEVEHWAALYRGSAAVSEGAGGHGAQRTDAQGGADLGAEAGAQADEAGAQAGAETDAEAGVGMGESPTPIVFTAGERAVLSPADGHLALVPSQAPPVVQAMVIAGNELQELPYGAAGHPDPRGASSEDCSSSVNYILYRAGVRPIAEILQQNPLAQDYVNWGLPGPGRWVSIYATTAPTDHVFVVIAGMRLDTSHDGTDVGPNRAQDGPRWRILDRIPAWAHWSVRHPPGL